jgi:hypothetical protein
VAPPRAIFTKYAAWWAPLFFAFYGAWGFITLADFGATSLADLNAQINAGTNSHFIVGQTVDAFGEHGYLLLS